MKWKFIFTRVFSLHEVCCANDGYIVGMKKEIGWGFSNTLYYSKKNIEKSYRGMKDEEALVKFLRKKIKTNPKIIHYIKSHIRKYQQNDGKNAEIIKTTELSKLSKADFIKFYRRIREDHIKAYSLLQIPLHLEDSISDIKDQKVKKKLLELANIRNKDAKHMYNMIITLDKIFFKEVGNRIGLSRRLATYLAPKEVNDWLSRNKKVPPKTLEERYKCYLLLTKNRIVKLYTGKIAQEVAKKELPLRKIRKIDKVKGKATFRGKIKGKVIVVSKIDDLKKIRKGSILVSYFTNPRYVPYLGKVSAILCEDGSLLSHAAIVSREMKIPCIIGIKDAVK